MCRIEVLEFFIENIRPEEFKDKRVLEVGSRYVNGSVRPLIKRFMQPKEYIDIDIEPGEYVDVVLPAEKLVEYFDSESFDVVISTETLEHVKDWRKVITNMKNVLN
ncbi:MAG: methyltransferase domain-containing protein [Sulfolobales archaeon]